MKRTRVILGHKEGELHYTVVAVRRFVVARRLCPACHGDMCGCLIRGGTLGTLELLLLGVALAVDAFSVTLANSFTYAGERKSRMALMPVFFGVFQALMPLLGYAASGLAASLIERYSGIVAFVILAIVGGKMIFEGVSAIREAARQSEADVEEPGEAGQPGQRPNAPNMPNRPGKR